VLVKAAYHWCDTAVSTYATLRRSERRRRREMRRESRRSERKRSERRRSERRRSERRSECICNVSVVGETDLYKAKARHLR
jgi:hypothetical protein